MNCTFWKKNSTESGPKCQQSHIISTALTHSLQPTLDVSKFLTSSTSDLIIITIRNQSKIHFEPSFPCFHSVPCPMRVLLRGSHLFSQRNSRQWNCFCCCWENYRESLYVAVFLFQKKNSTPFTTKFTKVKFVKISIKNFFQT